MTAFDGLPKPAPGCWCAASLLTVSEGGGDTNTHIYIMPGNSVTPLS